MNTSEAALHDGPPGGALGRTSPLSSTLTGAAGGTTGSRARADVNSAERALIRVRQKLQVCRSGDELIGCRDHFTIQTGCY